jgi:hypothetical protein
MSRLLSASLFVPSVRLSFVSEALDIRDDMSIRLDTTASTSRRTLLLP